jgi:hypothetical protein
MLAALLLNLFCRLLSDGRAARRDTENGIQTLLR